MFSSICCFKILSTEQEEKSSSDKPRDVLFSDISDISSTTEDEEEDEDDDDDDEQEDGVFLLEDICGPL